MSTSIEGVLVPSSNRGRYAVDDSEGHDITSGEHIAINLGGTWIEGHIEGSGSYDYSGCYNISDSGRPHRGPGTTTSTMPHEPLTQEVLQQRVQAAMREGMSLADALDAASGRISALFRGYYFIAHDGTVCGLCTGMKVRYYL